MKNILITGGPTNEYIDEVMKITNMSTGSLALDLANEAVEHDCHVTLIVTNSVTLSSRFYRYEFRIDPRVKVIPIETTKDMYDALESLKGQKFDTVIHASAVGDYKPEFTFRMEDLAKAIAQQMNDKALTEEEILKIMESGSYKVDSSSKISSYEPNLTVKLTLTTKLIANLRTWFPDAKLIGCKLLENVSHEHLIDVATKLCNKNDLDVVMANDLAELRDGQLVRYLVNKDGDMGISLVQNGNPSLLEYAKKEWF
ncbi:MAG: phosphopantothenoylcysteine decarboxylase [Bacillota bacterium]|nr:phosphopantothenoylcysteine decarboxylase [Bacillota bacterium]